MRVQPAIASFTVAVRVAAGVFAPGHLGGLTQVIPFELVDAVLAESGKVQTRVRLLPSRVGVYLLLAMALFEEKGILGVWGSLVAGVSRLPGLVVAAPSEAALRALRRRVGVAPLKALFEVLAGPLAQPGTLGVRYRGWRTVAFDGCSSLNAPDSAGHRGWLHKLTGSQGPAGYPSLRLMALVETGSRGLLGAVFGPTTIGERAYARQLCHLLGPDVLLLADQGFDGQEMLGTLAESGAQLLIRWQTGRRLPIAARLPDDSYLTRIGGRTYRVIEAQLVMIGADGSIVSGFYRLVTTLTDHRRDSASVLLGLYHERWEIESAFYALRHTLLGGRVLRSKDRAGLDQELWALLTVYQALRILMVDAAESVPGTDLDRVSFTLALHTARDTVTTAGDVTSTYRTGQIHTSALTGLLPTRRGRFSSRKVKSPTSRYAYHTDGRPLTSTTIIKLDSIIHPPPDPNTPRPPRSRRWKTITTVLRSDPTQSWTAATIAEHLNDTTNTRNISKLLQYWARKGLIRRSGRAVYSLTEGLTTTQNS